MVFALDGGDCHAQLRDAMENCDYCDRERMLAGDLPLCASCAARLSIDPDFAGKLSAHYVERSRQAVERMRNQVIGMRLLTPESTKAKAG